jgi:hypothetical protein
LRSEDVERVERIGADVARHRLVRIGLALRRKEPLIERPRIRDIDDRPDPP